MTDHDWAEAFGAAVGVLMYDRDLTAYQMAKAMRRPLHTVNRYFLGQRVPPATVFLDTAEALGVTADTLATLVSEQVVRRAASAAGVPT